MADLFDLYGVKEGPKVVSAAMAPMPTSKPGEREWGDVALSALKNAPGSAVEFAKSLVQPILHPVDTAKGLGELATGVASKLTPAPSWWKGPGEDAADATGQYFKDRYGGMENIKNTLATDPVGLAGDASVLFSGGSMLPVRGAQTLGRVGAMIDPLAAVGQGVKGATGLAGKMAGNALGATTGAGAESVKQAFKAGSEGNRTFLEHMRSDRPITEVADMARDAVDAMRQERSQAYKAGMADVSKDKTVLDFAPIDEAIGKANDVGTFHNVVTNRSAGDTTAKMFQLVDEWKGYDPAVFHTPEGLDALKRAIGDVRDSTEHGTPSRVAADRVYSALKGEIEKQAPGYAKTMADYAKASDELKEVTKTFSLGEKASDDAALRKLQSITRNNVQTNYGERVRLADVLAKHEPNLQPAIAGQAMNTVMPRGLVARGSAMGGAGAAAHLMDPTLAAMLPLTSPRLVGEAAYGAGAAGRKGSELAEALAINAPNARTTGQVAFQGGRNNREQETRSLARALMLANERRTNR
jgi:hypothetical protein